MSCKCKLQTIPDRWDSRDHTGPGEESTGPPSPSPSLLRLPSWQTWLGAAQSVPVPPFGFNLGSWVSNNQSVVKPSPGKVNLKCEEIQWHDNVNNVMSRQARSLDVLEPQLNILLWYEASEQSGFALMDTELNLKIAVLSMSLPFPPLLHTRYHHSPYTITPLSAC